MAVDSRSEFRRKNDAQFKRAKDGLQFVAREFVRLIAVDLVELTPGFGNQMPPDTFYIPTGRLRGGWNWTLSPMMTTAKGMFSARHEDGPFSDYGRETIERIEEQLVGVHMGGVSYLENDVAYGHLIVHGEGRHAGAGPRNWPYDVSLKQHSFRDQAVQALRGRF